MIIVNYGLFGDGEKYYCDYVTVGYDDIELHGGEHDGKTLNIDYVGKIESEE